MYMAELHSYYMDPHAHGDTKWNNLNGIYFCISYTFYL